MPFSLHHEVSVADARAHLLEIQTVVRSDTPLAGPITLFMPVWTPGSYLVREYARHVEGFACVGAPVEKVRKNAWKVGAAGAREVTVRYRLYCNELTVRTNHLDETHAFLNGAATFLAVDGEETAPASLSFSLPEGWKIATPLPRGTDGSFQARDLDTLVDDPIELGRFREESFAVLGKAHRYVIWPEDRVTDADMERLVQDTRTVLETEARLFDGGLPYDDYLILLHLSPRGRGGLEHRSSCSLLANPAAFATRDAYLDLLALVAHECFHAWNVKRLRPLGLTPYRYQEENYTRLLWWFEGATAYYDWRVLRLAKLCTVEEYLDHLATEMGQLELTHGRLVHSLEEASFDAWIKLYRPDENTANSSVSYYRKGEVVCAMMDLELRARTGGRVSLESVLLYLWESYGVTGVPVPEAAMQGIFERVAEVPLADLFGAWIRAPGEIDHAETLASVGLRLERGDPASAGRASLGVRARAEGGRVVIATVTRGSAAQKGGIDPGDELIALAGRRVEGGLEAALLGLTPKEEVTAVVARDGRLVNLKLVLDELRSERTRFVARPEASPEERARLAAWLGDPHPAWGTP